MQEGSTFSQQMRENKRTQGRFMNQLPRMAYGVREKRKGGVALQWLTQGVTFLSLTRLETQLSNNSFS